MNPTRGLAVGNTGKQPFELPLEIATQAVAILGMRDSGKTVTANVIVEELLGRGMPVVIIDPTDVWWGLKSSADGKSEGHPVVILGGPHGELPLEEDNAPQLADFAVEQAVPLVLSLRHLRKAGQRRFVTDFCEQLYHRKGELEYRTPLFVAIDEASLFVPQKVGAAEARMVGAIEDLVRRGRAAGIGVALIDQRPASVNKDVLTQLEVLVSHRITAPHDRKALDDWVRQKDSSGHREEFLEGLSALPQGTAWFWSPLLDMFERVAVRMRWTYDSSKTPALGETRVPPAAWATVDLDSLRALLESVERPEDSGTKNRGDSATKRVVALEKQVRKLQAEQQDAVETATIPLREEIAALHGTLEEARALLRNMLSVLDGASLESEERADVASVAPETASEVPESVGTENGNKDGRRAHASLGDDGEGESLSKPDGNRSGRQGGKRRILGALAYLEALGISQVPRSTLAAYADFKPSKEGGSGTYREYLAGLGREGYLLSVGGDVMLTEAGREEAARLGEAYSGPRTLDEFHDRLTSRMPTTAARMLRLVIAHSPESITREDLAERSDVTLSGTTRGYLADFSRLGLVVSKRGRVTATEQLFPKGLS